ncbi:MAG: Cell division FtsK/SpoIIIE [Candidatus Jorgensenbacteria bacterium GW2011_GWA2_45_9]|uniref:Cell division FtsK/SpoIIIE n=1 Tax=Candidatus Jorgensenbacteria bacterium GW2011_GWA2_45_9 TaxID=1618663 RepID=A0A0G1N4T6_9BACT|nr:MAG: Cell division FtsK/SpoIIIE [Candidatus Jorgensenbacteria bacterium GW2011_GWA2_45_9]
MAKKSKNKKETPAVKKQSAKISDSLHPDILKTIWVVLFLGIAILFLLAGVRQAGPFGDSVYNALTKFFGWGYFLFPMIFFILAFSLLSDEERDFKRDIWITAGASILIFISGLGFIDIIANGHGGLLGSFTGKLKQPFGTPASILITFIVFVISSLVALNRPLNLNINFPLFRKKDAYENYADEEKIAEQNTPEYAQKNTKEKLSRDKKRGESSSGARDEIPEFVTDSEKLTELKQKRIKNYIAPPLSILSSTIEKPTIGDLRANANMIKRTLESFGISVEMGEINVGPTVTRYTLKPAEGVRLSKIIALNQDLALSLAAHPIRIEAPIPGKSLVGIEVPNKAAAIVRLGSILLYPEFQKSSLLTFGLGRNVSGEPIFQDISKMPHLLVAGATGSGKSIMLHAILLSILFKNSPDTLRLILVDPKRVELSVYGGIPHLLAPVITENKKALGSLRWAIQEMDRRYQLLLESGSRDIKSYHKNHSDLPYILIVIDELADLMSSYGREVEGAIIRLAQMARATGIHLIVSTQRPSVEVITGLIKANITTRIALQVASQVDSRTILDSAGAEKLLGRGDLLFVSSELSKPKRVQGAYISEDEIKKVVEFIKKNNPSLSQDFINGSSLEEANDRPSLDAPNFEAFEEKADDDELYEEAVEVIRSAGKASASLLQRRLKVGYARAARLLDMMEERGVVGPGEGAKPRDVLL